MRTTKNILGHSAFWLANKKIAKYFKCNDTAILLAFLIDKEQYHRDRNELIFIDGEEYFYATSQRIEEELNIGYKKQKKILSALKDHEFVIQNLFGVPAKLHFCINHNRIVSFVTSSTAEKVKPDLPDGQIQYCPKGKSSIAQKAKLDLPKGGNSYIKNKIINNNTIKNKDNSSGAETAPGSLFPVKEDKSKKMSAKNEQEIYCAKIALERLNELAGRSYATDPDGKGRYDGSKNVSKVVSLLRDKYSLDEILLVIEYKCWEWMGDPKMEKHLSPDTLFGSKFRAKYLSEALLAKEGGQFAKVVKKAKKASQGNTGGTMNNSIPDEVINAIQNW